MKANCLKCGFGTRKLSAGSSNFFANRRFSEVLGAYAAFPIRSKT